MKFVICLLVGFSFYGEFLWAHGSVESQNYDVLLQTFEFPERANRATTDPILREALYNAFGGLDYYTGLPLKFADMHIDHVWPKSKGGPDNYFNYVPTSSQKNLRKGAKMVVPTVAGVLAFVRTVYADTVELEIEKINRRKMLAASKKARQQETVESSKPALSGTKDSSIRLPGELYRLEFDRFFETFRDSLSVLHQEFTALSPAEQSYVLENRHLVIQTESSHTLNEISNGKLEGLFSRGGFSLTRIASGQRWRLMGSGQLISKVSMQTKFNSELVKLIDIRFTREGIALFSLPQDSFREALKSREFTKGDTLLTDIFLSKDPIVHVKGVENELKPLAEEKKDPGDESQRKSKQKMETKLTMPEGIREYSIDFHEPYKGSLKEAFEILRTEFFGLSIDRQIDVIENRNLIFSERSSVFFQNESFEYLKTIFGNMGMYSIYEQGSRGNQTFTEGGKLFPALSARRTSQGTLTSFSVELSREALILMIDSKYNLETLLSSQNFDGKESSLGRLFIRAIDKVSDPRIDRYMSELVNRVRQAGEVNVKKSVRRGRR